MDKLAEIMDWKRREIAPLIRPVKDQDLENLGDRLRTEISFLESLSNEDELSIIAEVKRKSPSAGNIAENISATEQARKYVNADADSLSILKEKKNHRCTCK